MRCLCVPHHRIHKDTNWKYAAYQTPEGERYGYFCSKFFKPTQPEFIPDRVREDRNAYAKSLLQPFRGGVLSQEYVKAYGTKRLNVTQKDVKKARPVWKDILPSNWEKSR